MSAYSDMILAHANLVAYWPLQEVAGTTATDVKGGYNGAYSGAYTLGEIGGVGSVAPSFGAGGKVAIPDNAVFDGFGAAGSFTLEAWVRLKAGATSITGLSKNGVFALVKSTHGYMQAITVTNTRLSYVIESGRGWIHLVGVWTAGGAVRVYVNGRTAVSLDGNSTGALVNNNTDLVIGSSGSGSEGWVEQVAFYNDALDAATVEAHYFTGAVQTGINHANTGTPIVDRGLVFNPVSWAGSQMRANAQELQLNVFKPVMGVNTDIVRH